jgi:hypothetical protein
VSREIQLIEKIVRAKVKLEGARQHHTLQCAGDLDPDGVVPCNCGADETNKAIEGALRELKLE